MQLLMPRDACFAHGRPLCFRCYRTLLHGATEPDTHTDRLEPEVRSPFRPDSGPLERTVLTPAQIGHRRRMLAHLRVLRRQAALG